jgi:uncharacterized protein (DUF3084 family)|tara:strand:- start:1261 stop:1512 length:252 start_codon:yes stop_codon:yes gene_type:complete
MEQVFLTKEEIKQLKDIQEQESTLITQFGQLEYQIQSLNLQKETLKNSITDIQLKSNNLGKELQDKYGEGNIDITSGEFTKNI